MLLQKNLAYSHLLKEGRKGDRKEGSKGKEKKMKKREGERETHPRGEEGDREDIFLIKRDDVLGMCGSFILIKYPKHTVNHWPEYNHLHMSR